MALTNEMKEDLRSQVRKAVNETFERKLSEAEEESEKDKDQVDEEEYSSDDDDAALEEGKGKKVVKEEDDEDESDKDSDDDDSKDNDEDEGLDEEMGEEDDESISESMKVEALPVGKNSNKKGTVEELTINRHADLLKLARSGKYEWFMVTKKNGEETEYTVDFTNKSRPELVEM